MPPGGSEHYAVELLRAMVRAGARVKLLTTTTAALAPTSDLGIRWDRDGEPPSGLGPVARVHPFTLPSGLARRLSAGFLARDALRAADGPPRGLYPEETWTDGGFPFRWTGGGASLPLPAGTRRVTLDVFAPRRLTLHASAGGEAVRRRFVAGRFDPWSFDVPPGSTRLRLRPSRVIRPRGDLRVLGVALRGARVETGSGPRSIPILDGIPGGDDAAEGHVVAASGHDVPDELALALLRGPLSPSLLLRAARLALHADVILAGSAPFLTMDVALAAGYVARRPVALLPFLHPADRHHHNRRIRAALRRAAVVFAFTEHLRRTVLDPLGCRSARILGGIDPAEHRGPRDDAARTTRRRLGIPEDAYLVLAVARNTPSKRLADAAAAVARARAEVPGPCLVVAGSGTASLALAPPDRAVGELPREELLALLAAADLLLHPSEEESLGLVILEAWAQGTPVVVNARSAALAELVRPGVDGLLAHDVPGLASAIVALASDRPRGQEMGAAGRTRTLQERSWDDAAAAVLRELAAITTP